jgi:hypothetical protein
MHKVAFKHDHEKTEKYKVKENETLDSIVEAKCKEFGDWKALARFNIGTDNPKEVNRWLDETVGIKTINEREPNKTVLKPAQGLPAEILIPKAWTQEGFEVFKTHEITLEKVKPPVAISVDKLDKWFIPKQEKCDIKYSLEGLKECADKVQLDVFGSNYCECTDWNKGLGTYGDPAGLADEPIYTKELPDQAEERNDCELPGDGWKGEATTTQGILGRKTGTAAARHINVAFSPYTVHFRHWKADGDNTARLVLKPFWPQWEEAKTEPAATPTVEATRVKIRWTNAAQADYGVIEITDATGQRVHLEVLGDDKLTAGNKSRYL